MLIFLLPLIVGLLVTPNLCDDQKNNCTSSYNEYKKIVEAILKPDQVSDINAMNSEGETLLMIAARNGLTEVVKDLLVKNATIDLQNKFGGTALMFAAKKGHTETVEILLEHRSDPDHQDNTGDTALKVAATKGFSGVVSALLKHKATLDTQTDQGHTAFMVIKALLKHNASDEMQHEFSQTALSAVQALLKQNATLDMQTDLGYTGLQFSAYNGNEEVAKILLQHMDDVDFRVLRGETVFMKEKAKQHEGVFSLIINNTANVNNLVSIQFTGMLQQIVFANPAARDNPHSYRYYSRKLANFQKHRDIVKLVLDNKEENCAAVLEAFNLCEEIPSRKLDHISALVACQAIDNCRPKTALHIAAFSGNHELMKMLLSLNNDIEYIDLKNNGGYTALMISAADSKVRNLELLLNHNATIDLQDTVDGRTALYLAVKDNHEKAVSILLANNANPDIPKEKHGITPLMRAAWDGNYVDLFPIKSARAVRIAEDLLRHNASVDLKGSWIGDTALMNAASGGGVEIGRLLLENNADAGIKNKLGETALDHAKRWNHPEFVKLLGEY